MTNRDQSGPGHHLREAIAFLAAVVCLMGSALTAPGQATAQALSVEETVSLVRGVYYEGMPEEEAAQIGPAGCIRLLEMLADPLESRSHAQVLLAIGICGPPGGFEAIRDFEEAPREGEVDRAIFRAWQALPYALGRLAPRDPRALARLEARLSDAKTPSWTFRHHRGARLVSQSRRAAATCLAQTGMPEAGAALDRARDDATAEAFRDHLEGARELYRESARGLEAGDDTGVGRETRIGRGVHVRGGIQGTQR